MVTREEYFYIEMSDYESSVVYADKPGSRGILVDRVADKWKGGIQVYYAPWS